MKSDSNSTLPPLLRACWIKLNSTFQKRLSELKITPDQYTVLRWLSERTKEQTTQLTLANLMFTDANNISALLKRMENLGLLSRFSNPNDKRMKIIQISTKGVEKFNQAKRVASLLEKQALSGFCEKEKLEFNMLLGRLNEFLNKS
ncbi:MAG: MarR family transcriptional regulator [Opitutae bacterium]|nr:MarR family transcriptional regulator [Opitutae bacterium]|tara:strand:- start:1686 stop:2123 length:438 start_codon:yes stop_codon:yes gene_type:complete